MAMVKAGLTKLMEECGELIQIAAKKSSYLQSDNHPDQGKPMSIRLEEEMGDVLAAIEFVAAKIGLSQAQINARKLQKLSTFREWDENEPSDL